MLWCVCVGVGGVHILSGTSCNKELKKCRDDTSFVNYLGIYKALGVSPQARWTRLPAHFTDSVGYQVRRAGETPVFNFFQYQFDR